MLPLEPGQQRLLRDVAAGKVARHRLARTTSAGDGQDYQQDRMALPAGLRKAGARLTPLRKAGLVYLEVGNPDAATWLWQLTVLGESVLAEIPKSKHSDVQIDRLAAVLIRVLDRPGANAYTAAEAVLDAGYRPMNREA